MQVRLPTTFNGWRKIAAGRGIVFAAVCCLDSIDICARAIRSASDKSGSAARSGASRVRAGIAVPQQWQAGECDALSAGGRRSTSGGHPASRPARQ